MTAKDPRGHVDAPNPHNVPEDAAGNKTSQTPGVPVHPPLVESTAAAPEAVEEPAPETAPTIAAR